MFSLDMQMQVFSEDSGLMLAHAGRLLIVEWRGPLKAARFTQMADLTRSLVSSHPSGGGAVFIIQQGHPMPGPQGRQAIARFNREFGAWFAFGGYALVIEGDGLWAASMRMVARSVNLASGSVSNDRVFRYPKHAILWAGENMGMAAGFRARELAATLSERRQSWPPELHQPARTPSSRPC